MKLEITTEACESRQSTDWLYGRRRSMLMLSYRITILPGYYKPGTARKTTRLPMPKLLSTAYRVSESDNTR